MILCTAHGRLRRVVAPFLLGMFWPGSYPFLSLQESSWYTIMFFQRSACHFRSQISEPANKWHSRPSCWPVSIYLSNGTPKKTLKQLPSVKYSKKKTYWCQYCILLPVAIIEVINIYIYKHQTQYYTQDITNMFCDAPKELVNSTASSALSPFSELSASGFCGMLMPPAGWNHPKYSA